MAEAGFLLQVMCLKVPSVRVMSRGSGSQFSEWQVSGMVLGEAPSLFHPCSQELVSFSPLKIWNSAPNSLLCVPSRETQCFKQAFYPWFENCIWIAFFVVIHLHIASFLLVGKPHLPASLALMDLLALSGLCGFKVLQTPSCHSNLNTVLLLLLHLFYKLRLGFPFHILGEWEVEESIPINLGAKKSG